MHIAYLWFGLLRGGNLYSLLNPTVFSTFVLYSALLYVQGRLLTSYPGALAERWNQLTEEEKDTYKTRKVAQIVPTMLCADELNAKLKSVEALVL